MTTLTKRADKARETLFERYNELNALWEAAEKDLAQFHIPRPVCCEYDDEGEYDNAMNWMPNVALCLGVQKVKGKWRICWGNYWINGPDGEPAEWTPITECSAEIRAKTAEHFPKLREKVVESTEKFIPAVDSAIQSLRGFLDEVIQERISARAKEMKKGIEEHAEHKQLVECVKDITKLRSERANLNGKAK